MSDTMLMGILEMPQEMAMQDVVARHQFYNAAQTATRRIRLGNKLADVMETILDEELPDCALRDRAQKVLDEWIKEL